MSFSLLAAVVSAVFAVVVISRYVTSRRLAFAAWGAGLLIFAGAAAFQAIGEWRGFSTFTFRGFYLLGGVLGVAYLALGTVYLMASARVARVVLWGLVLITVATAISAATVPVDATKLGTSAGILGDAIEKGTLLHLAAVILNIAGTIVLVGGSGWSAWRFIRGGAPLDRVICNVLLTAGAFVIAAGFSAAKVSGGSAAGIDTLGLYEAIGITVMFCGFLALGRLSGRARRPGTLHPANPTAGPG